VGNAGRSSVGGKVGNSRVGSSSGGSSSSIKRVAGITTRRRL
jgi:hypothetical protein